MTKIPEHLIPEYFMRCSTCGGAGEYGQLYNTGCGQGLYSSMGPCEYCRPLNTDRVFHWNGTGLRHRVTGEPPSMSVMNQIKQMAAQEGLEL